MRARSSTIAAVLTICIAGSHGKAQVTSHIAPDRTQPSPRSPQYQQVQQRLARGWNTWDVHSVATQVLLPEGLAIHVGLKHNSTLNGEAFLGDALIGRLDKDAEKVTPGPHSWDGSYTRADFEWKGYKWRVESAHGGNDLVMLVRPLASDTQSALPPTVVFSVNYLWNLPGAVMRRRAVISSDSNTESVEVGLRVPVFCTCEIGADGAQPPAIDVPWAGAYFAADLTGPVGVSTGTRRSFDEIRATIDKQKVAYD